MATKNCYQLVENSDVYLHAKSQIYSSPISWDISKILQLGILGTLGINSHIHQKGNLKDTLMFIYTQKINFWPHFFLEISYFK